jgi:two-component system, OmpR family, response regulator
MRRASRPDRAGRGAKQSPSVVFQARTVMALRPSDVTDTRVAVVVEDDPDISMLLKDVLEMAGFTVHEAASGRDGIHLVRSVSPDLVTLDLGLPDVDGITVCRTIREFTDAYVLMITARTDEIDRLLGLEIGADDFVDKPFSPREIQARVTALFRRPRSLGAAGRTHPPAEAEHSVVRHGELEVDLDGRIVTLAGAELSLTRIEFDLLATMLGAPRRVWTRENLLRTVWGAQWVGDDHLVEVHVGNLRRKLGDDARTARWIRTVRGVGYRLAPAA